MLPDNFLSISDFMLSTDAGSRHATLIDPDNQTPGRAAELAQIAIEAGTDLLMIGGSTGTHTELVEETVLAIQESIELRCWAASQDMSVEEDDWKTPLLLFPNGSRALSPSADGLLFMMMMNSRDQKFLIGEQYNASTYISQVGLETIPMGYLVFEPGMRVGEIGSADLISPSDITGIEQWSLTAHHFGFSILYLEAGSGADTALSINSVSAARNKFPHCLMVGGGIREPSIALAIAAAGADWIVTGNLLESFDDNSTIRQNLKDLIVAVHRI